MIGIFLLLIALYLYFKPKYRYISYFLYISFVTGNYGGFNLWTDSIVGFKQSDCALIYSCVILLYIVSTRNKIIPHIRELRFYKWFLLFLILSFSFSIFYYGLTPYEVLQGGRHFFLVLMLPILIRVKPDEFNKIIRMMMWMCFITSILYIGQVILKRPLMPNEYVSTDRGTGLLRFYNMPSNITFFLSLTFLYPEFYKRSILNINIFRIVFIAAQTCTLGRTAIATCFLTVLLSMILQGSFKRFAKTIIILGIFLTPFIGTILQRFNNESTNNDIERVLNGDFNNNYEFNGDATMLYRFAWIYERSSYLLTRPASEQFFGMGLCTESTDWPFEHYNFKIGLTDELGRVFQLSTPDIAYGNLITFLGFGGAFIYLLMLINLTKIFWKNRQQNAYITILTAMSLMFYLYAFSGSTLSNPKSFAIYFLGLSLIFHKTQENNKTSNEI